MACLQQVISFHLAKDIIYQLAFSPYDDLLDCIESLHYFIQNLLQLNHFLWKDLLQLLLILHRISRLNAPTSVGYKWWQKTCKMNTKSEGEPE